MTPPEELRYYKVLFESARSFGKATDLETLLDDILDRSKEVVGAEACSILLPAEDGTQDLILYTTHKNVRSLEEPPRIPSGKGIAGAVFQSKEPLNIKDVAQDPRHFRQVDKQANFHTRSMLTIPLLERGQCVGVMQALNASHGESFGDSCLALFEAFGMLIVTAIDRLKSQKRELQAAKAKQELALAQEIQSSFLPAGPLTFPGGNVHFHYCPASEVGGDFYFCHTLPNERTLLGVGDVSGKGIPAALTMARISSMIAAHAQALSIDSSLGEWVSHINQLICADLTAGRFVSVTFLLTQADLSTLEVVAAGLYPPAIRKEAEWTLCDALNQPPLGVIDDFAFQTHRVEWTPGDRCLLFSDGMTEVRNEAQEELGLDAFIASLPTQKSPRETLETIVKNHQTFAGQGAPHDDASLLILDWRGPAPPPELSMTCAAKTLCQARDYLEKWATYAGFNDLDTGHIVLAVDEAASNVLRHSYGGKPGPIHFKVGLEDGSLVIRLEDDGTPVKPEKIKGRELDELRPGGLGTVIIQKTFDQSVYQPLAKGSRLILSKKLPR